MIRYSEDKKSFSVETANWPKSDYLFLLFTQVMQLGSGSFAVNIKDDEIVFYNREPLGEKQINFLESTWNNFKNLLEYIRNLGSTDKVVDEECEKALKDHLLLKIMGVRKE